MRPDNRGGQDGLGRPETGRMPFDHSIGFPCPILRKGAFANHPLATVGSRPKADLSKSEPHHGRALNEQRQRDGPRPRATRRRTPPRRKVSRPW